MAHHILARLAIVLWVKKQILVSLEDVLKNPLDRLYKRRFLDASTSIPGIDHKYDVPEVFRPKEIYKQGISSREEYQPT